MKKMEGREREGGDESWGLTSWERQCIEHIESQTELEAREASDEKDQALHRLWNAFQNAAMACAQLYKERHCNCNCSQTCGRSWTPFQDTANTVTLLYKDGMDTHKRSLDIGFQSGIQKRNKDIVSWAKKKRKLIRRDDLLSYLAGRSPPRRSPEVKSTSTSTLGSNGLVFQAGMDFDAVDAGLQCYRPPVDNFDVRPGLDTAPFFAAAGVAPFHNSRRRSYTETNLVDSDIREGRKRSACPADIVMESPSHKRNRYS